MRRFFTFPNEGKGEGRREEEEKDDDAPAPSNVKGCSDVLKGHYYSSKFPLPFPPSMNFCWPVNRE